MSRFAEALEKNTTLTSADLCGACALAWGAPGMVWEGGDSGESGGEGFELLGGTDTAIRLHHSPCLTGTPHRIATGCQAHPLSTPVQASTLRAPAGSVVNSLPPGVFGAMPDSQG